MDKQTVPQALADSITEHLNNINKTIVARGKQYYRSGNIVSLTQTDEHRFEATVEGSDSYSIVINTNSNDHLSSYQCDCPYDYGNICKHIAATLLAIREGDFVRSEVSQTGIRNLIDRIDSTELHQFLCEYADRSPDFRDLLYLRFGDVQADRILASSQRQISSEIRRIKRYDYIDESDCAELAEYIDKFLNNAAEYACRGETLLAFRLAVLVLKSAEEASEYADEYSVELEMLIDDAISQIGEYAKKLAEAENKSDCNAAFNEAAAVMENCIDKIHPLITAILPLANKNNTKQLYSALDEISAFFPVQDMLVRYEILTALGDKDAAHDFIYQHLAMYEFRKKAVDMAMEQQDYSEAERLCLEALEKANTYDANPYWNETLLKIYRETNDQPKLTDIMLRLIMDGQTQYYTALKEQLYDLGLWDEMRPSIIPALSEKLSIDKFSDLMISEHEYRVLLDFLETSADPLASNMIFKYRKQLSEESLPEVCFMLRSLITAMAERANYRDSYHDVCLKLIALAEIGCKADALNLIEQFRLLYKRKSAFADELNRASREMENYV